MKTIPNEFRITHGHYTAVWHETGETVKVYYKDQLIKVLTYTTMDLPLQHQFVEDALDLIMRKHHEAN